MLATFRLEEAGRHFTDLWRLKTAYKNLIFIYGLCDEEEQIEYVGSSLNPLARYMSHFELKTADSSALICRLAEKGLVPAMKILDVTLLPHREVIESRWIHESPTAKNSKRHELEYRAYKQYPHNYPNLYDGTLFVKCAVGLDVQPQPKHLLRPAARTARQQVCEMIPEAPPVDTQEALVTEPVPLPVVAAVAAVDHEEREVSFEGITLTVRSFAMERVLPQVMQELETAKKKRRLHQLHRTTLYR